ncbi:MAG: NHLP bacteriocin system secretion protein [bacterium]|nr:NHLP bacteriocin system secretion protein [bacterium]MYA43159.1 NHLP bacteriocin system secretion protein [Gemmatimonadota bacterium]MYE93801.1 NHLP bacteriocin system secretion protein [Gemmatimonadota bacterium]MYJ11681.1 NHLP bacteriocin system secretion protein [Gemmatimonadota bacterium]
MQTNRIFRQASLDRMASPEQLDQIMTVTSPRGWIALATIGLILVGAVTWGIVGSLSEKVTGQGMLVRSGGVLSVVSPAAGQVADIAVAPGDSVSEGEIITWIAQPDLSDELQHARERLDALRLEHGQTVSFVEEDVRLRLQNLEQEREDITRTLEANQASLTLVEERIAAQEQLVTQGLVTRTVLLAARQQYESLKQQIRNGHIQMEQIDVRRLTIRNQATERIRTSRLAVDRLGNEVDQLNRQFRYASQVVSPYTGRVLEVMIDQGQILPSGAPILSLDRDGPDVHDLVAIVYVPSFYGKMVQPGMEIHIAPSTVRQEEYGMMLGEVTFVSSFPASHRGMVRVLKNEQLVRELSGGGAPYEIHAQLTLDPATATQYRWTSSTGPTMEIQSGTTAGAQIIIAQQRPISRVIPLVRRWTGI